MGERVVDSGRVLYDSSTTDHDHVHDVDTSALTDIEPDAVALSALPVRPAGTRLASVEVVIRVRRPNHS